MAYRDLAKRDEYRRNYYRQYYAELRDAGLCVGCKADSPDFARCSDCRVRATANHRGDYHARNYYKPQRVPVACVNCGSKKHNIRTCPLLTRIP